MVGRVLEVVLHVEVLEGVVGSLLLEVDLSRIVLLKVAAVVDFVHLFEALVFNDRVARRSFNRWFKMAKI